MIIKITILIVGAVKAQMELALQKRQIDSQFSAQFVLRTTLMSKIGKNGKKLQVNDAPKPEENKPGRGRGGRGRGAGRGKRKGSQEASEGKQDDPKKAKKTDEKGGKQELLDALVKMRNEGDEDEDVDDDEDE